MNSPENHPKNRSFPKEVKEMSLPGILQRRTLVGNFGAEARGGQSKMADAPLQGWPQSGSPPPRVLKGKALTVSKCHSVHL